METESQQTPETISPKQIAAKYNVTPHRVYYLLKSFCVEPYNGQKRNKLFLVSDIEDIFNPTK
jgi:hypothetical protein